MIDMDVIVFGRFGSVRLLELSPAEPRGRLQDMQSGSLDIHRAEQPGHFMNRPPERSGEFRQFSP